MSTLPDDAWRDAGLVDPDDTTSLVEETQADADGTGSADDPDAAEEYRPGTGRPDLEGAAAEADVVEQSHLVPAADEPDDSDDSGADEGAADR